MIVGRSLVFSPRLPSPATAQEIEILARTIYGEARGEPLRGRVAVAWVILNRTRADIGADGKPDWWGEGIIGVCCKPWQFSCWNENDPNRAKLTAVSLDDDVFRECHAIATLTAKVAGKGDADLEPLFSDPTGGAVAYVTRALLDRNPPAWARDRAPDAWIGNHAFFREVF